MTDRFNPFPPLSCRYGAPMGRFADSLHLDPDTCNPDDLCTSGPQGEYDCGGAYWGSGGAGPVYAVWVKGRGREGVEYVRAYSREGAKRKVLESAA